jgi:hypothetical protein
VLLLLLLLVLPGAQGLVSWEQWGSIHGRRFYQAHDDALSMCPCRLKVGYQDMWWRCTKQGLLPLLPAAVMTVSACLLLADNPHCCSILLLQGCASRRMRG